jgi:methionine-rich copper-binding protein CopC
LTPLRTGQTWPRPPRLRGQTALQARLIIVGALATALVLISVQVADAHSDLLDSTPAAGAVLDVAPDSVELVFATDVQPQYGEVTVTGPDGDRYDLSGSFTNGDSSARVGLRQATVPGPYTVTFRIVSTDGHVLGDGFSYRVTRNGADPSGPRPKASSEAPATTAPNLMGPGADSSTQGRGALVRAGFLVIGAVLISFVIMATSRRRNS